MNSPHKGQWRENLIFILIYAWKNGWVNNGEAGDWRRHRAHYDVIVMHLLLLSCLLFWRIHLTARLLCRYFKVTNLSFYRTLNQLSHALQGNNIYWNMFNLTN